MRVLIKNGTVVSSGGLQALDVLVEGGKIAALGTGLTANGAELIDAGGLYVFAGFIDAHTHLDLDLGFTRTADNFETGSRAAILGGTTTILDFVDQKRGEDLAGALRRWHALSRGSSCNYGFHMALSEWNERIGSQMGDMLNEGVSSFKMYMVYDMRVDDGEIYCALKRAGELGAIIGMHCENYHLIERLKDELRREGRSAPACHALSRPALAEAEAVSRYLRIARLARAPAYVVHLSTGEGLSEARLARARGQEVYLETCPQYLVLDDERYNDPDAGKFVMSPPLRKHEDNEALFAGLAGGEIDTVATDHCSFTMAQKALGKDDFTKIPNGGAGVQTRAMLYYTYGVTAGRLTLKQMAAQLSENPAKLFGMYPRKGLIAPGADADIVLWDPKACGRITHTALEHNCDNTPYEGMRYEGAARDVLLAGIPVVRDGALIAKGLGSFVRRGPSIRFRQY